MTIVAGATKGILDFVVDDLAVARLSRGVGLASGRLGNKFRLSALNARAPSANWTAPHDAAVTCLERMLSSVGRPRQSTRLR